MSNQLGEGFDSPAIEQNPDVARIQSSILGSQLEAIQVVIPDTDFVADINGLNGTIVVQAGSSAISAGTPDADIVVTTGAGTISIAVDVNLWPAALAKSNTAIIAPTVNDDSGDGYNYFSTWIDTVLGDVYMCVDPALGAAVWRKLN